MEWTNTDQDDRREAVHYLKVVSAEVKGMSMGHILPELKSNTIISNFYIIGQISLLFYVSVFLIYKMGWRK